MQEHLESIGKILFYTALAGFVYFKPKIDKWRKSRKINLGMSIDVIEQIDNHCYYLLGSLKAKRISVWQFGNGEESFSGFSFKYSSMIGEAVQKDQASLRNKSQKIPIYDYIPVLKKLKDTGHNIYEYEKYDYLNTNIFHILTSLGIMKCVECKLNEDSINDGFLSIAFSSNKSITKEQSLEVERVAMEIYKLIKNNGKTY